MIRKTQNEIIRNIAQETGLKQVQIKSLFDALQELAVTEIRKNGKFSIPGFGKLIKTTRPSREGRNPATGERIQIPAGKIVKLKLGKAFFNLMNLSGDPIIKGRDYVENLPGDNVSEDIFEPEVGEYNVPEEISEPETERDEISEEIPEPAADGFGEIDAFPGVYGDSTIKGKD